MKLSRHDGIALDGSKVQRTAIHLSCGHFIIYDGTPAQAEQQLFGNGGTRMRGSGLTRCRACTELFNKTLFEAIHSMVGVS